MASSSPAFDSLGSGPFRRDALTIGLVGVAHCFSHFFQLVLPPLFPLIQQELGVGFVTLGAVISVFYVASGVSQVAAGFAVDRFGARPVLFAGLALLAGGCVAAGAAGRIEVLFMLALAMGMGNGVFHPADFAILNARIRGSRLGYAYSIHGVGGSLGYALAPIVSFGIASVLGWRAALMLMGPGGLVLLGIIVSQRDALLAPAHRASGKRFATASLAIFRERAIRLCFVFFGIYTLAVITVQTFSAPALHRAFAIPLGAATTAVTAYLLGSTAGILAGGVLASRTRHHDRVAGAGLAAGAALMLAIGSVPLPFLALVTLMAAAGFALGSTGPSRDMIVKAATPPGASGRTYGFVYSGLDLGATLAPLMAGALMDRGAYRGVFYATAAVLVLCVVVVMQAGRGAAPRVAVKAAGD